MFENPSTVLFLIYYESLLPEVACTIKKLQLNANKCYVMSFTKRCDATMKDPVVIFDSKLSFDSHFQSIIKRTYRIKKFIQFS